MPDNDKKNNVVLKDSFKPSSAQDCGMEEAFGHGLIAGPTGHENCVRKENREIPRPF